MSAVMDAYVSLIDQRGGVSFVELAKVYEQITTESASGDVLFAPEDLSERNIWLWAGSEGFCDSIHELMESRLTDLSPTSILVYLVDGRVLDLPVAKTVRHYKAPRWAPCVLNPKKRA